MTTRRAGALAAAILVLLAPAAFAQGNSGGGWAPSADEGEAIDVGPFLFSPALQLTWEDRDNIFYTPDNEVSDQLYVARALLMLELPIYDNYVRFTYNPQYREFRDYDYAENWTHPFGVETAFEFPSGLKLLAGYSYFSGALEVRQVDPGGELMYGEDRFRRDDFRLTADYWFNPRDGLRVEGAYGKLAYKEQTEPPVVYPEATFYDYDDMSLSVGWLHQLSPTLVMDLSYRRSELDSQDTLDYRDQTSDDITVGFDGQVTELLSSRIEVGWRQTQADTAPGDPDIQDYSNLLVNGHLGYQLAHGSTLRLNLLFTDYPSNYGTNAFYTAYGGNLTYDLQRERLSGQVRLGLQTNSYDQPDPTSGLDRSDDIVTFGLGLNYRFTTILSLAGAYLYEDRDSLYDYSYTSNAFVLSLVVGYGYN